MNHLDYEASHQKLLRELLGRALRVEAEETEPPPTMDQEWPEVDRLLHEAFTLAGPLGPPVSLVEPVLLSLRAEGLLVGRGRWPAWIRRTSLQFAALLLLVVGSGLAVLLAVGSATLAALGVAGSAVWSSRVLVLVFEAWAGLATTFSGVAATMRAVLLGEAAPVVGLSLMAGCAVVGFGFALALRTMPGQGGGRRTGEILS